MKEGSRSGNPSARLEKDKGPFGCLIIDKRGDGMSSSHPSRNQTVFKSKQKKNRRRLILSDSESEEDLIISRKVTYGDSSASVSNNSLDSFKHKEEIDIDRDRIRPELLKCREDAKVGRNRFVGAVMERKRSRMDVFEHNEDIEIDKKTLKKERFDDKDVGIGSSSILGSNSLVPSINQRDFETECSRSVVVNKRKHNYFDRNSSLLVERNRGDYRVDKKRFEMKKDGTFHPDDILRKKSGIPCGEPIRVQGKNGVLKVMLNKKVSGYEKTYGCREAKENIKGSRYADTPNWKAPLHPPFYSEKNSCEKSHSIVLMEKNRVNSVKSLSTKNNEGRVWRTEVSDMSLLPVSKSVSICSSKKEARNKGETTLNVECNPSTRRKEGEVKCGRGTEKQLLRERIRRMLVNAGWTIDFRLRKSRNYQDAVYINPSGTEYWSIIKAYDALKKEFQDEDSVNKHYGSSGSFSPIPEEVLSQLTRQSRKKNEREIKMKHKAHKESKNVKETSERKLNNRHLKVSMGNSINGKKLNSFVMQNGKSLKARMKGNSFVSLNVKGLDKSHKSTDLNNAGFGNGECLLHEQVNSTGTLQKGMPKPVVVQNPSFASDFNMLQGRKYKKQSRRALLVRSSNKRVNSDNDYFIPYTGKRTVLSWLIDMGAVPLSGKVQYMSKRRTRAMLEGWITRDGIHCACCSKILTISKFEIHAGSKLRQPFQNIFVETGVSLSKCLLEAWNRQEKSERCGFHFIDFDGDDPNDDTCGICGDGGDLICCDGCPSTFHQSCLGIQMLPPGDWHCPNCSCKFCGVVGGSNGQGKDITFSSLPTCSLCEEKYHQLCSQGSDAIPIDSDSLCAPFCGQKCKELFQQLQKILGVKHELEAGFSWTLIRRSDLDTDPSIRGLPEKAECNSKLAVALTIMDECFLPIIDRRSGVNLIHNVLYNCGSNLNRLNYSGFYTIVLERGDEIISAASIRIHGTRLAEMPFIGTRHIYRRQGMCRRLLNVIESALRSLNVEKLIIPAISELMNTWTVVFGFMPLEKSQREEMRFMNMLIFPDTDLLQKQLLRHNLTEGNVTDGSGLMATELKSNHHNMPEVTDKCSSVGADIHTFDKGIVHHAHEMENEVASVETISHAPGGSIYDTSDMTCNPCDAAHGSIFHAPREEFALDTQFLHSGVTHHSKQDVENRFIFNPPVGPKLQSSTEDVNDAHEVNVEVADVELGFHSLAETSIQHTSTINEYPNAISGYNFQSTNGTSVQRDSDLNHHNPLEVDCKPVEVYDAVFNDIHVENVLCTSFDSTEQDALW